MLASIFDIFHVLFGLVFFAFVMLGTLFWIWMLVECATKEPNEGNEKLVWVIIIALTHLIGAGLYYFVRRPKRITDTGQ